MSGVRLLTTERTAPDAATMERLESISRQPWVREMVALGDVHWKPRMETPSSTATATGGEIVMGLSSSAQNCGMMAVRTPLHAGAEGDMSLVVRLMHALREEIPRSRTVPIITREESLRFVAGGAAAAAEHFGLSTDLVAGVEGGGSLFDGEGVERSELLSIIDEKSLERGRSSFAFIGGGNHFLEIQAVEEILEPEACRELGIHAGQIMIMFHTGSERLGSDLGRLFAVRLKTSANKKRKYFFRKIPLHLIRGMPGPVSVTRRVRYYFSRRPYIPVPVDSAEGRRMLLSLKAGGNYGYANRIAVLALIQRALGRISGAAGDGLGVVADLSHNVIAKERIAGEDLWMHRHNAVRLRPPSDFPAGSLYRRIGQPSPLPGTNRTSSYLILSREGATATLNSADHGAGQTVELFEKRGLSRERQDRRTLKFGYRSANPTVVSHLGDEGVDEVIGILRESNVAVPAARLRPLAVLKG